MDASVTPLVLREKDVPLIKMLDWILFRSNLILKLCRMHLLNNDLGLRLLFVTVLASNLYYFKVTKFITDTWKRSNGSFISKVSMHTNNHFAYEIMNFSENFEILKFLIPHPIKLKHEI